MIFTASETIRMLLQEQREMRNMEIISNVLNWSKDNSAFVNFVGLILIPLTFWLIREYRNRIHVKVRRFGLPHLSTNLRCIEIQAENVSSTVTSFEPDFTLTGFSQDRKKQTYTYRFVDRCDRTLLPHVPCALLGWHAHSESRIVMMLSFLKFRLPLSQGGPVCLCYRSFRNTDMPPIPVGPVQFYWELLVFRLFGKIKN
jgi:hypothetical protein